MSFALRLSCFFTGTVRCSPRMTTDIETVEPLGQGHQLPPTLPSQSEQRTVLMAENHGLRFQGADLPPSCFTNSRKAFQGGKPKCTIGEEAETEVVWASSSSGCLSLRDVFPTEMGRNQREPNSKKTYHTVASLVTTATVAKR